MKLSFATALVFVALGEGVNMVAASQDSQRITITRRGSQPPSTGPAEYFTGSVRIEPLFQAKHPARASGARVTFEPGARTAWHTHPLGQILFVTAGTGRVQQWGGPTDEIREGDVVWIPPGQKHWHGASPTTAMTHIAIQEALDGKVGDWLEKVSDDQYTSGLAPGAMHMTNEPRATRNPYADIAPALGEYTDKVLFGDVWERPGLSKRDRSLITVATLIALYRTNELPFHLKRALENGVTKDELIEVITHLAFYAGWPPASSAVGTARQVFAESAK